MKIQYFGSKFSFFLLLVGLVFPCTRHDGESAFICPGPDVMSERVFISFKRAQLNIICSECEVKSQEVTSYLKSIAKANENVTSLRVRDCLLPTATHPLSSQSFKVWLESVNSLPEKLLILDMKISKTCSNPNPFSPNSSNLFDGLHNLQHLRLYLDLITTLPPGLLTISST